MSGAETTQWGFSPQQWEAVTAVDRHVLVSAGAGTGKTRTVVGRILYLLGVPLEPPDGVPSTSIGGRRCSLREIAAITFTNAAAADLKKKLRGALVASERRDVAYEIDLARIGTIHSFCIELLREFALHAGTNPREEIVDEATLVNLRTDVVGETILHALEAGEIAQLQSLFARFTVNDVRVALHKLLGDSDRLRRIRDNELISGPERALVDLAALANGALESKLVDLELIDFDRVIVRARDLLRTHPHVRSILRRRIRTLIIDEFQDVDPVQKEIAYLIGDPGSGRADTPRLMLVGDAKQSIYRFRRADVRVWTDVLRDFEENGWGKVCTTTASYRCSKQILGFVDATIGKALDSPVLPGGLQKFEVPSQPLSTALPEQQCGPPVELLLIPANEKGKQHGSELRRSLEVSAVAERARALHEAGYGWGEMAVVLRKWTMANEYLAAFEAVGVPAYPLRTTSFYEEREILDIQLALEAICDPADDRALVGFLRSPFVGVSDETLLRFRRTAAGPLWASREGALEAAGLVGAEAARLATGVATLERYAQTRDRVPTHELLESLLFETGYLGHLYLLGPGKDKAASNVAQLLRQARNASRMNTAQFLRFLRQCRDTNSEISSEKRPREDAVTITTTHSAKGLEWKVVFWGGLGQEPRRMESGGILIGRDTIALREPGATQQSPAYETLQSLDAAEGLAEEKRLWYVTATRAIERLVLCGISAARLGAGKLASTADYVVRGLDEVADRDGSTFHYIGADGTRLDGIVRLIDPGKHCESPQPESPAGLRSFDALPEALGTIPVATGRTRHSATEYLSFTACPRRHWFKYTLGIREPDLPPDGRNALVSAVLRGQIVHDVLERLREGEELDDLLDDAIRRSDANAPDLETPRGRAYREHLKDEIERIADNCEYRAIADQPNARRELPFLYIAGEHEYYEGSIDLAAAAGDTMTLLDVKTPQCDPQTAAQKASEYRPQRDVYLTAAEGIGGGEVGSFLFQFSRANCQIGDPVDAESRSRAARFLSETKSRIESGDRATTVNGRECEYCGYRSVGMCGGAPQQT